MTHGRSDYQSHRGKHSGTDTAVLLLLRLLLQKFCRWSYVDVLDAAANAGITGVPVAATVPPSQSRLFPVHCELPLSSLQTPNVFYGPPIEAFSNEHSPTLRRTASCSRSRSCLSLLIRLFCEFKKILDTKINCIYREYYITRCFVGPRSGQSMAVRPHARRHRLRAAALCELPAVASLRGRATSRGLSSANRYPIHSGGRVAAEFRLGGCCLGDQLWVWCHVPAMAWLAAGRAWALETLRIVG
jgi:hypothetical protein